MSSTIKFRISNKRPEKYNFNKSSERKPEKAIQSLSEQHYFRRNFCTEVLTGSKFSSKTRLAKNNGFLNTVLDCYNHHHNLVIRPDDIWTAIMTQFSFYINASAKMFPGKYRNFLGKKELKVTLPKSIDTANYKLLVKLLSEEIMENLLDPNNREVKPWILPDFSTTTADDLISCGVLYMVKWTHNYTIQSHRSCGIPYVILEGSVTDWEGILTRLEKLKEYDLTVWYEMLRPILMHFIEAKNRNSDQIFWQQICKYYSDESGQSYLSGWITAFCVFNPDGKWQGNLSTGLENHPYGSPHWPKIPSNNIPSGIVEVELKIDDNGNIYHSTLFTGHIAYEILGEGKSLKPKIGWTIALKPHPEKIEILSAYFQRLEEESKNRTVDRTERKKAQLDSTISAWMNF